MCFVEMLILLAVHFLLSIDSHYISFQMFSDETGVSYAGRNWPVLGDLWAAYVCLSHSTRQTFFTELCLH